MSLPLVEVGQSLHWNRYQCSDQPSSNDVVSNMELTTDYLILLLSYYKMIYIILVLTPWKENYDQPR